MKKTVQYSKSFHSPGRKGKITLRWKKRKYRQAGSAIILIIVAVTITAILGAGMLSLFSSSTFSELFINNRTKAYYLAQAGRQYAAMIINDANIAGKTPAEIDALLNGKTFTLSDGNEFYLRTNSIDNVKYTLVEATGIVNKGTALETKQKIVFQVASTKFGLDVFAFNSIQVSSRVLVDSYDSGIGPYDATIGSPTFNKTKLVKLRTNGTTTGVIEIDSGGEVDGQAICGAACTTSACIANAIKVYGTLDPGPTSAASVNQTIYTNSIPASVAEIYPLPPKAAIIDNTNAGTTPTLGVTGETHIYKTGEITYYKSHPATITIKGKVKLIVDNALVGTGNGNVDLTDSKIIIEKNGSLDLYVRQQFTIAGNTIINPPCRLLTSPCPTEPNPSPATAVTIWGIDTPTLTFTGNSVTYGGINAPGATPFALQSESQLYGSIVAKTITMSGAKSGCAIHVDKGFSKYTDKSIVY